MESVCTTRDFLVDNYGRRITYLRVSLTESCNLRCGYCYGDVRGNKPTGQPLENSEIIHIIGAFSSLGISKVRFTGGEPLLRKGFLDVINEASGMKGISSLCLTTNGTLLDKMLPSLINAGLNRLNVSLDTLNEKTFRRITGSDGFGRVFGAIKDAAASGAFGRVKINVVFMRGINDTEIPDFAQWALNEGFELRFIEYMHGFRSAEGSELFVGESEIKEKIGVDLDRDFEYRDNSGPSEIYRCGDLPGRIGFISAISRSFCGTCNRLRLTSGGELVGCLFGNWKAGLKSLLNDGATVSALAEHIRMILTTPGFRRDPREGAVSVRETMPYMRGIGG